MRYGLRGFGDAPMAVVSTLPTAPASCPVGQVWNGSVCAYSIGGIFLAPAMILGIKSQDMIPANQILVSAAAWGAVAYLLLRRSRG